MAPAELVARVAPVERAVLVQVEQVELEDRAARAELEARAAPAELAARVALVQAEASPGRRNCRPGPAAQANRALEADPPFPPTDLRALEEPVPDQVQLNSLPHGPEARRVRKRRPGNRTQVHFKVAAARRQQASVALPAAHPAAALPVQHLPVQRLPVQHLPAVQVVAALHARVAAAAVAADVDRIGSISLF